MKIVPHLWFDRQAREAALFYVSLFENSKFLGSTVLEDTPSGDSESVHFELAGQPFEAISAGTEFKLNPSISLMVACASQGEVDAKWRALSEGGTALMELGEYPFSRRYGWIQDRYGLSWQLMLMDEMPDQKIKTCFLFAGPACGKAEEAVRYYAGVFPDSEVGQISRYAPGEAALPEAKVNYAGFKLMGQDFVAMDHGYGADFTFNEAFSLMVQCEDQNEIDFYWEKLSHVPEAEACGWVKDRFGVSWQIVPKEMGELFASATGEQARRLTQAFLRMKKLDIAALWRAIEGRAENMNAEKITIHTVVRRPLEDVWRMWTTPRDIMKWNSASDDWHTPWAENDLQVGGMFRSRMEAKDGSTGFEFSGTYDEVVPLKRIAYTMPDGRKVAVEFEPAEGGVRVTEVFDAEGVYPASKQRDGWQAILDHFKRHAEANP